MAKLKSHPVSDLPNYTIRVSLKAKYLRLQITAEKGLEVIVPKNYAQKDIPEIIRKKQDWIEKATQKVQVQHQFLQSRQTNTLPDLIDFEAVGESWQVEYISSAALGLRVVERPDRQLIVCGNPNDVELCRALLRQWITRKAHQHLVPWLQSVSRELSLPFAKASVRGQKTRWASCSEDNNISINYKLLFIPPPLVHYVFVHELCHTIHLNHSAKFWALVELKAPDYERLDRSLRQAWRDMPAWVNM
jgi:predicted metal-dependent hydrolase